MDRALDAGRRDAEPMTTRSDYVRDLLTPGVMGFEKKYGIEIDIQRRPTEALNREYGGNIPLCIWDTIEMPIFVSLPNGKRGEVWNEEEDKTGEWKAKFQSRVEALIKGEIPQD